MKEVDELHKLAMDIAEKAYIAHHKGHFDNAKKLTLEAFQTEQKAAMLVREHYDLEPTRSVLFRSAASLALDCGKIRDSERLISIALAGNPPQEIAEELRDLMKIIESKKTKQVFLGGTCNDSPWREILIGWLEIDYFNPVVEDWTEECMAEEIRQREICDYVLYVITPSMTGVYSIAEVVDDSNKRPDKTVFCVVESESVLRGEVAPKGSSSQCEIINFDKHQLKSLKSVAEMVKENGATVCENLQEVADFLNK